MKNAIILILSMFLAAMPTTLGTVPGDVPVTGPERFAVGFHVPTEAFAAGDDYQGSRVLSVNHALRFLAVEADEPLAFKARTLLDDRVRFVEPDPMMQLIQFTPDDPRYANMYGPQQIGAPAAWDKTLGSTAVTLCVTDTGVRTTHEDLTGRYGGGHDFVNNDADPNDDNGHGTHVTGTATASTNNAKGIAGIGQSTYKHAKVLNSGGSGTWTQVADGVTWCADNGAHVISMSLGGSGGAQVLLDAINYAWGKGAVIAASAGNSGPCSDCVGFPAAYANTIAVSCTTSSKAFCSFSSEGPEVDLAAPGNAIDSTCYTSDTAYCSKSGTSMSAPHVAGAAALLKANDTSLTNSQIRSKLEGNAEDLGAAGLDDKFGHGLVRPDLAMGGGGGGGASPPGAPESLTAKHKGGPNSGKIQLNWVAPGSNGGAPITDYKVYRGTASNAETFLTSVGNVLTYTDTGLTKGVTYYYKVSAVNSAGEGPLSNEASAVG